MKAYDLFINDSDLETIRQKGEQDGELVFGRQTPVMLSDAKTLRHSNLIDIYDTERLEAIVRLCAALQEACTRAVECGEAFPVIMRYRGIQSLVREDAAHKMMERPIAPKIIACGELIYELIANRTTA